jgi:hypothetical protein
VNKHNTRFSASKSLGDVIPSYKIHHVVCSQQARAYGSNLCGGHHNISLVPVATAE